MERQEGLQELLDLGGPRGAMVAAGEVGCEGGRLLKPSSAQAKEVSTTDAQELGGGVRIEIAAVESVRRLVEELSGKTFGELMFCTRPLSLGGARRARLFVGLRFAPASSKPGPAGERSLPSRERRHHSLILFPPQQFFCFTCSPFPCETIDRELERAKKPLPFLGGSPKKQTNRRTP